MVGQRVDIGETSPVTISIYSKSFLLNAYNVSGTMGGAKQRVTQTKAPTPMQLMF